MKTIIDKLLHQDDPDYVSITADRMMLGHRPVEKLAVHITDIIPVRKLFENKRTVCWSMDGRKGRHGQFCALCRDRWQCTERLRLMLIVDDDQGDDRPAILEINRHSFADLNRFIHMIGEENLPGMVVRISLKKDDNGTLRFVFEEHDGAKSVP